MSSDVRQAISQLQAEGWTYEGLSKGMHHVMTWTDGQRIVFPGTPSDHRSIPNMLAQARRISGVQRESHRSPKFRVKPSEGFNIDLAAYEARQRRKKIAELHDQLQELENRMRGLNPRRQRSELVRLATRYTHLSRQLEVVGTYGD